MKGVDLAKLRKQMMLTQEEFAKRLNVSRAHLARLETQDGTLPMKFARKVQEVFHTQPDTQKGEKKFLIPFYNVELTSTPMLLFTDPHSLPSTEIDLPGYAGSSFAINMAGNSMYPVIESGSMIIVKEITDKSIILYGEIYLVVTKDYRMVKRLRKSKKHGWVIAASENRNGLESNGETYADIEIPINKIEFLYLVQGSIKRHQI